MRIVRFKRDPSELAIWGWMADERIGVLDGSPFDEFQREEARLPIEETQLVAPVVPGKIICVGLNYAAHAAEHDVEVPDLPLLFLKPPSAVIGSGQPILLPPQSQQIEHEAELAVIISQRGRWIRPEQVANYVLGFTAANDVTARDLQFRDGQWTRSKGFDTFCPLGPWIETEFEPADALITCSVNGQMRQMASTRDMIFTVPHIVAYISSVMTLEAGDVILTGTPPGVGPLSDGDEVTVEIEGLGTLRNSIKVDLRGK